MKKLRDFLKGEHMPFPEAGDCLLVPVCGGTKKVDTIPLEILRPFRSTRAFCSTSTIPITEAVLAQDIPCIDQLELLVIKMIICVARSSKRDAEDADALALDLMIRRGSSHIALTSTLIELVTDILPNFADLSGSKLEWWKERFGLPLIP